MSRYGTKALAITAAILGIAAIALATILFVVGSGARAARFEEMREAFGASRWYGTPEYEGAEGDAAPDGQAAPGEGLMPRGPWARTRGVPEGAPPPRLGGRMSPRGGLLPFAGAGHFGGLLVAALLISAVVFAAGAIRKRHGRPGQGEANGNCRDPLSAEDELRLAFAEGRIDEETYRSRLAALRSKGGRS